MQRAGAAHAAHDLVEDQQHAVPVADLAHALEIAGHGGGGTKRCARHRLGHERRDGAGSQLDDLGLQLASQSLAVGLRRLVRPAAAVLEAGRHVVHVEQHLGERRAILHAAAHRQGTQRDAVIALPARDELGALRLALLDEVVARHLQAGLDRLRAAAAEVHVGHAARGVRDQVVGQLLGDARREEAGVRVGDRIELLVHGGQHVGMGVAEAGHRRAARCVDVLLAGLVRDADAGALGRDRILLVDRAVQDVCHWQCSCVSGRSASPSSRRLSPGIQANHKRRSQ